MLCYAHTETDPAFNLAAEEYLLKHADDDCFMLWRNRSAVIVGKNQNAMAEINPAFVERHGIRVVRRISGGGTVYHDLGNVNFTFIKTGVDRLDIDFAAYTRPILGYLNRLSVPARRDGRSDLAIGGLKISGNAQHVHKKRVLHHGTLLFDTDLDALDAVLRVDPGKYADKAVQSIRSRVTNIRDHLPAPMAVEQFMAGLGRHVQEAHGGLARQWTMAERSALDQLADRKYRRWTWNFGASPDYTFKKSSLTSGGTFEVRMAVQAGTIRRLRIIGDLCGAADAAGIESHLTGCRHQRSALRARLAEVALRPTVRDVPLDLLLDAMF